MELCRRIEVPAKNTVILGTPSSTHLGGMHLFTLYNFNRSREINIRLSIGARGTMPENK